MARPRAFTLMELLVVISIIALLIGILLPALGAARRTGCGMKNSSQLRGIHQSMVIYAQSNNTWCPGLDTKGNPVANGPSTGNSGPGDTVAARYWVLLDGQFIPGSMLINPQEAFTAWSAGPLTAGQYSYAALDISAATGGAKGRRAEWRDNANSQALLMSDRNIGTSAADADVRSLWTPKPGAPGAPGDWRGNTVWGDNHASFEALNRGFKTRYASVETTSDNLFASTASSGVTDTATDSGANALMAWP